MLHILRPLLDIACPGRQCIYAEVGDYYNGSNPNPNANPNPTLP